MLGFVIAAGVELATGKQVTSQLFDEVVQKSTKMITHSVDGLALSSFGFVVIAVTMGSLAPLINGSAEDAKARSGFGPFTPEAELRNARAAMLGFAALLATEAVKGSALF